MKVHVEIGHLTKYDAFRVYREQAMNLEIWFKIHTNVPNFETASPKTIYKLLHYFMISMMRCRPIYRSRGAQNTHDPNWI